MLESFWIEMSSFRFQNMLGKFEHLLRYARVGHLCENVLFVAHLVIVAQRYGPNQEPKARSDLCACAAFYASR
jgi:hypothetical protein